MTTDQNEPTSGYGPAFYAEQRRQNLVDLNAAVRKGGPCPSCGGIASLARKGQDYDVLRARCSGCGFEAWADDCQDCSVTWKQFSSDPKWMGPKPAGSAGRRCESDYEHLYISTDPDQVNCDACDAIRIRKGLPKWSTCWTEDDE